MLKCKTKSIWTAPHNRFYNFLNYTQKNNLDKNLLVIGCSDGTYAIPAAKRGYKVTALDVDKESIYGGNDIEIGGKVFKYLGLKKRIELEGDIEDKIEYEICNYMDYNTTKKFSLIFTSGSIHYACNSKYDIKKMIFKMIDMLETNGVLLLEYICKDNNTDKDRHFVSKKEVDEIISEYKGIEVLSHKTKKYIEESNPRDNKVHEITWGRLYLKKLSTFVEDIESATYYDALPRFDKKFYNNFFKETGITKNSVLADIGCGTGRITIDLLENGNKVYAIDPDINMREICLKKCEKYKDKLFLLEGTDVKTNLKDESIDYVIVSQSLHRFNLENFRKECNRILRKKNNIIIIWYRVNFEDEIISEMLSSVRESYSKYRTRYNTDEKTGARIEESENNESATEFLKNNSRMVELYSVSCLTREEFLKLGLSLSLLPTAYDLNKISKLLRSTDFNKEKYLKNLNKTFDKYSKNNLLELKLRVQVHIGLNN